MKIFNKKGFTLIELLVVIAIIGILASIILASLDSSRKKGRDARRLADIKQIQLALELYYDQNNAFPPNNSATTFDPTVLTGPGYISVVPVDPQTGTAYKYTAYYVTGGTNTVCVSYHLAATLESVNHSALNTDSDISASASGGSGGNKPPTGYGICQSGAPPANDFDGLATGANCSGVVGTPVTTGTNGTELCYDVKP
jgi:prepilin-type N-terminal cleavage/methylation domain-containing protein